MGYIKHEAVIVTTSACRPGGLPDIDAFRASLPEDMRQLVIGPIETSANSYVTYAFLPDGSKEGWYTSDRGDAARADFKNLFRHVYDDGSSHDHWSHLAYGSAHVSEFGHTLEEVWPPKRTGA